MNQIIDYLKQNPLFVILTLIAIVIVIAICIFFSVRGKKKKSDSKSEEKMADTTDSKDEGNRVDAPPLSTVITPKNNIAVEHIQPQIVKPKEEVKAKIVEPKQEEIKAKIVEPKQEEVKAKIIEPKQEEVKAKIVEPKQEEVKVKPVEPKQEEVKAKIVEPKQEEVKAKIVEPKQEEVKAKAVEPKQEIKVDDSKKDQYTGKWKVEEENGTFKYVLYASNGELLLSSEPYTTVNGAKAGYLTMQKNIEITENQLINQDKNGNYNFKLYSSNKRLICIGESYSTKNSCVSALESMKRFAKTAIYEPSKVEVTVEK